MTFSRLFDLIDAHADRKRREHFEEGALAAMAAHDPKQLRTLAEPVDRRPPMDPDWRKGLGLIK